MPNDVDFSSYEASKWIATVNNEVEQVRELLTAVTELTKVASDEKDTIMGGIASRGEELNNRWQKTINGFEEVGQKIWKIFDLSSDIVVQILENIKKVAKGSD